MQLGTWSNICQHRGNIRAEHFLPGPYRLSVGIVSLKSYIGRGNDLLLSENPSNVHNKDDNTYRRPSRTTNMLTVSLLRFVHISLCSRTGASYSRGRDTVTCIASQQYSRDRGRENYWTYLLGLGPEVSAPALQTTNISQGSFFDR